MYREKHGCNSMPPLRMPFNHKVNTLLQQKQIFHKKFSVHFSPFFDGLPDCCFSALFSANFLETAERAAVIARCLGEWLFGIYYFFNYAIE